MAEPTGLAQREWLFSPRQLRKNSLLALVRYGVSVTVFALSYRLYLRWLPLRVTGLLSPVLSRDPWMGLRDIGSQT